MSKLCPVCGTENRDEAKFCRSCGASFTAPSASASGRIESSATANVCGECSFQNKPGLRYCANCGMSLAVVPREAGAHAAVPPSADANVPTSPPPISYPSFPPVAPYPPPPRASDQTSPSFDNILAPDSTDTADISDPDTSISVRHAEAYESTPEVSFANTDLDAARAPGRPRVVVAGLIAALVVGTGAAWWYMSSDSGSARAPGPAAMAPSPVVEAPAAIPASAPIAAPILIEAAPASAPAVPVEAAARAPEMTAAPAAASTPTATATSATATPALAPPPAAAAALPQIGERPSIDKAATGNAAPPTADATAKRLAAEKVRREKLARDKADREAKAKALADQDTQSRRRADEQQRARAEEAQRARAAQAQTAQAPAPAKPQGVHEICAGRGTIAEAVCQARQCASSEHASEPVCRQLRDAEERRRNYAN